LRNAVVIIYSRGVLQPSGIRRFGNGVSQLSPLQPVLGNGDPLSKSFEMPLLLSAFSNVLPQVISGQPILRATDTAIYYKYALVTFFSMRHSFLL